ncbi:hypothetical protein ACFQ0B_23285 [Nonomuraea thailandensis]
MPFDPEATGVIPKLTFPPAGEEAGSAEDSAESSGGEGTAPPEAERTTAIRLPGPLHIGHPPTADDTADPSAAGTVSMPIQPATGGPEASDEGDTSPACAPNRPAAPARNRHRHRHRHRHPARHGYPARERDHARHRCSACLWCPACCGCPARQWAAACRWAGRGCR